MTELVGAMAHPCDCWHHHLLAFDRIAWPYAHRHVRMLERSRDADQQRRAADIRWMIGKGLLFVPTWVLVCPPRRSPTWVAANAEIRDKLRAFLKAKGRSVNRHRTWSHDDVADAKSRLVAIRLREIDRMNAVPVTSEWTVFPEQPL